MALPEVWLAMLTEGTVGADRGGAERGDRIEEDEGTEGAARTDGTVGGEEGPHKAHKAFEPPVGAAVGAEVEAVAGEGGAESSRNAMAAAPAPAPALSNVWGWREALEEAFLSTTALGAATTGAGDRPRSCERGRDPRGGASDRPVDTFALIQVRRCFKINAART